MRTLAVSLFFALAAIADAGTSNGWDQWKAELHRQCPSRHVEWISGGGYDEILAGFAKTLPAATNRKIDASADFADRCARETAGFGCEMTRSLDAFSKLGLMRRFAAFGCREYKCDEPSLCAKTQGATVGNDKDAHRVVHLAGTILKRQSFGPPGFGETPKQDGHVTYYVLRLKKATTPTQLMLEDTDGKGGVPYSYVQLSCDDDQYPNCTKALRRYQHQVVTITGSVNWAIYPTEYLPLVLAVLRLDPSGSGEGGGK